MRSLIGILLLSILVIVPSKASAVNLSTTTCPGSGCQDYNVSNQATLGLQLTGTWVGTITFQGSIDGSTFVSYLVFPSTSTTGVTTATGNGEWTASVSGLKVFRVVFTAYTSGTAVLTPQLSTLSRKGGSGGGSVTFCGSDTQVIFNDGGGCGADADLTWDKTTNLVGFTTGSGLSFAGAGTNPITLKGGNDGSGDTTIIADSADNYIVVNLAKYTDIFAPNFMAFNGTEIGFTAGIAVTGGTGVNVLDNGINVNDGNISGNNNIGIQVSTTSTANAAQQLKASAFTAVVANNISNVYGTLSQINANTGTAVSNASYLFEGIGTFNGTSTQADLYGIKSELDFNDTATAGTIWINFANIGGTNTTVSTAPIYAYWAGNLQGKRSGGNSSYPFWYEGIDTGQVAGDCNKAGVWRVNQFGILAYYNPCFVPYTPDLANFERLILRWGDTGVFGTDNRAYAGVEVGGTGTARALNLIGANLSFTSTLTPAVTDTSANSCGTGTQTIVGNDNAGKVTVIGSAGTSCTVTFATAFTNAPSCTASNETSANLARATSTTTTVVLAGTFAQNDVISYVCIGR